MSDHPIHDRASREDRAVFAALERMEGERGTVPAGDEDLVREYQEVLGSLPYGLDPAAPAPEIRTRLLASLGGESAVRPAAPPSNVVPMTPPVVAAPRSQPWLGALAAMLALCLLGLGYLSGRMSEQTRTIARLGAELRSGQDAGLAELGEELTTMKRRFHMVTSIARQAYHMEGVELVGSQTRPADGVVYVCGYHQRWYLNLQGLEPPPEGKEYNLWFLTADGMVNGGTVSVGPDASSEREAQSMPEGTHGFAVSLEDTGRHEKPEGMMVLLGEEAVSL